MASRRGGASFGRPWRLDTERPLSQLKPTSDLPRPMNASDRAPRAQRDPAHRVAPASLVPPRPRHDRPRSPPEDAEGTAAHSWPRICGAYGDRGWPQVHAVPQPERVLAPRNPRETAGRRLEIGRTERRVVESSVVCQCALGPLRPPDRRGTGCWSGPCVGGDSAPHPDSADVGEGARGSVASRS